MEVICDEAATCSPLGFWRSVRVTRLPLSRMRCKVNSFDEFQERTAAAANMFFWWYILPAAAIFALWFYWNDIVWWWGPSAAFGLR